MATTTELKQHSSRRLMETSRTDVRCSCIPRDSLHLLPTSFTSSIIRCRDCNLEKKRNQHQPIIRYTSVVTVRAAPPYTSTMSAQSLDLRRSIRVLTGFYSERIHLDRLSPLHHLLTEHPTETFRMDILTTTTTLATQAKHSKDSSPLAQS